MICDDLMGVIEIIIIFSSPWHMLTITRGTEKENYCKEDLYQYIQYSRVAIISNWRPYYTTTKGLEN